MKKHVFDYLIFVLFFLLPWQTVYLFNVPRIAGEPSPFGVLGLYAVELLVLLIALTLDLSGRGFRVDKESRRPIACMTLIFLAVTVSFIFSDQTLVSLAQVIHLFFAGLLFLLLLEKEISAKHAMAGFVAGLILPSILGCVQVATGGSFGSTWLGLEPRDAARLGEAVIQTSEGSRILRAYGSFPHPNIFGGYVAVGLVSIFGLWPSAREKWQKIFLVGSALMLTVSLILTFSRSAWLGLALAVIVGAIALKLKPVSRARMFVIPVAAIFIAAVFFMSFGAGIVARPGSDASFEERSIDERVLQYQEFPKTLDGRWLIGHGPGTYPWANEEAFPEREWFAYQPIHNVFLLILGELGILGVVAVLVWSSSIDQLNFSRFPNRDAVCVFMMGNVILVVLFFDHYLWTTWAGLALVAYVMALTTKLRSSHS